MTIKTIPRAFLLVLLFTLASIPTYGQQAEYPDDLKQKFVKPEVVQRQASVPKLKLRGEKRKGFFKSYGKAFWLSSAVYWAGTGLDIASSQGKGFYEGNANFRRRDGSLATGKNLAVSAGVYAVTVLFEKWKPQVASFMRFAIGGGRAVFGAARNWGGD